MYASPCHVEIDVGDEKADTTSPSYPDICFGVHDHESAFQSMVKHTLSMGLNYSLTSCFQVLSDDDDCFCVVLAVRDGPTVFSGFVSVNNIRAALPGGGDSIL